MRKKKSRKAIPPLSRPATEDDRIPDRPEIMSAGTTVTNRDTPFSIALALIRLMRPEQWIKNGFVLAPLVFAGRFTDRAAVGAALLAALLFSLASSATYILNDIHDLEQDRKHPRKSRRPLAAGQVSPSHALVVAALLGGALVWGGLQRPDVGLTLLAYIGLNLAYTFVLKHQPVIDIFSIAIGFILRVQAGALAVDVPVSTWMFVTTLCLALYLASIKRRQELAQSGQEGRRVLAYYSVALVDRYAEMAATGTLLFYSLFVMTVQPDLALSIPFVLYGLFRYWFVVETLKGGESPTDALFSDWQLSVTILLWLGLCLWALWPTGV